MTGAAFASEDLELIFPGDKYLMHSGEVKDWPIDKSKGTYLCIATIILEGINHTMLLGLGRIFWWILP